MLERLLAEWAASRSRVPSSDPPAAVVSPVPESSDASSSATATCGDGDGEASFREAARSLADLLLGERFLGNTTDFGDREFPLDREKRAILHTYYPTYRYGTRYSKASPFCWSRANYCTVPIFVRYFAE